MLGTTLAVLASTLSSAKDVVSKKLSSSVDSNISTFASFAFPLPIYVFFLGLLAVAGVAVFETEGNFWSYAVARAVTDSAAEWCKMAALASGELSVVSSLFALYPLLLLLSAPWITGDPLEPSAPLATVIIVLGTLIILHRPRGEKPITLRTVLLSLAAAFFFSLNTALDRAAVQHAHPVFSAFVMTLFSALLLGCTLRKSSFAALRQHQGPFTIRAIFEVLFMTVKLWALTMLSAPLVVGIGRLSTVLNVLAGHLFFKEQHLGRKLFGALVVVSGVTYLLLG